MAGLLLAGCEAQEKAALNASVYNYTDDNLAEVRFNLAGVPFNIEDAASADSVYFRNASKARLDDGRFVFYSSASCCFYWDKKTQKKATLRVVWQVVYDLDLFEGESGRFDPRTVKQAAPGSRWCEAIVPLHEPSSDQPDNVRLHFLRDGTVVAELGDIRTEKPLAAAEVALHATPLPKDRYCLNQIDNPWYGMPRKPHRE